MNGVALLAPLFLVFELWQLVMSERYVGIKQIARGAEPREMGPSEPIAFLWTACILIYGLWILALLATPRARLYALVLIVTSVVGYSVRRNCDLNRILVVLTFEGAIRVAALSPLTVFAWSHL